MSDNHDTEDSTPRRFRRLKFNPLRDVLPYVCIVVGLAMALRRGFDVQGDQGILVIASLVLVVIGITAIPLNLWMKKRGL